MGVLARIFAPMGSAISKVARGGFKYLGSASTAGKKGLRKIKRGGQKALQTVDKPAGEVKNVAGIKRFASGKLEPFGKSHSKIKVEGGGKTIIDKTAKEGLQNVAYAAQTARRNVAVVGGAGGLGVGLGLASEAREKPSTARDIKEKQARNAPLEQKDAPPMENQAEVKQQAPKKAQGKPKKGGRTPFQDAFKAAYAGGRGLGSTFSFGKPGQEKQYLAVTKEDLRRGGYSTLGEWQRGQRKAGPSVAKGTSSENFKGHGGGYGLDIAGPVAKTTSSKQTKKAAWEQGNLGQKIMGWDRSGANTSGLQSFQTGLLEGDMGFITEKQKDRRKSGARKGTFGAY